MEKKSLTLFQDNVATLTSLVGHLAVVGEYEEAERYLARLAENDIEGFWLYASRLNLAALRGDLPSGSEQLRVALADPHATNYMRGIVHFILGDVAAGAQAWRNGRETSDGDRVAPLSVGLLYTVNNEVAYPAAVLGDPRYQDVLDEFGVGRTWTAYMKANVAELAPITGIELGDPAPQRVATR